MQEDNHQSQLLFGDCAAQEGGRESRVRKRPAPRGKPWRTVAGVSRPVALGSEAATGQNRRRRQAVRSRPVRRIRPWRVRWPAFRRSPAEQDSDRRGSRRHRANRGPAVADQPVEKPGNAFWHGKLRDANSRRPSPRGRGRDGSRRWHSRNRNGDGPNRKISLGRPERPPAAAKIGVGWANPWKPLAWKSTAELCPGRVTTVNERNAT